MSVKTFGFAWLSGEFEAWSGALFRVDEQFTAFKVSASEGDCDTLDITIKNPKRGLLNGPIWASLSYGNTSGDAVEIFRGRLTGIPQSIIGETIDLMFIAKPSSYDQQLVILADQLRALPPYDCVWIDPDRRTDPMTPLESLSALYFCDRVTHAIQVTDMINGEDGLVTVSADDLLYDDLNCGSAGDPPITSVTMIGHANWKQQSDGVGFPVPGATGTRAVLNGSSICSSWPKTGDTIAGGYTVTNGFCTDVLNIGVLQPVNKNWSYENRAKSHTVGDVMSSSLSWTVFPAGGHSFISNINTQTGLVPAASVVAYQENEGGGYSAYDPYASIDDANSDQQAIPMHVSYNVIMVPNWRIDYGLSLTIGGAGANASETIQFTITSDLQPVVILPDPTVVTQTIELSTQDLTSDIDAGIPAGGGDTPALDPTSDSFAATDRGTYAVGYLVALGRAAIRKAARATSCTGTVTFDKALQFTLRRNAIVVDPRLPAGNVQGKITGYSFGFDGEIATGTFQVLPAVGNFGTVSSITPPDTVTPVVSTTNVYIDDYIDNYYQTVGSILILPQTPASPIPPVTPPPASDIGYSVDPYTPAGLSALTMSELVVAAEWQTSTVQVQTGSDDLPGGGTRTYFNTFQTDKFHLELKPLSGMNLAADVTVTVTPLIINKQIDLSAAPL